MPTLGEFIARGRAYGYTKQVIRIRELHARIISLRRGVGELAELVDLPPIRESDRLTRTAPIPVAALLPSPGRSSAFGDSLRSGPGSYPEGPQAVRIDDMTPDPAKLLEEALKLSPESRAALAASLLQSLDEEVDEDAEAAWAAEIAKRIRELDSGAVMAIPWSEARRRILDR